MRIILNMSHARCLFARRAYAARLAPRALREARPFSPPVINRGFSTCSHSERGGKTAGPEGSGDLTAPPCAEHKATEPQRLGCALWESAGAGDAGVSFAGGAAVPTGPIPGSPSHQTSKGETEAACRSSGPPAREGAWAEARGQSRPRRDGPFSITPSARGGEGTPAGGPASRAVRSFRRLLPAGPCCPPSCRGPCRPPTRRPSASARAGASGHAGASVPTAASARAASPPAPPGTPCPGIYPSTSRGSARARTRCWTRPRGLSSGWQVRQRPVVRWDPWGRGDGAPRADPAVAEGVWGLPLSPAAPQGAWGWVGWGGGDGRGLWWLGTAAVRLCDGFVLSGQGSPRVVCTLGTPGLRDDGTPPTLGLGDIKMSN